MKARLTFQYAISLKSIKQFARDYTNCNSDSGYSNFFDIKKDLVIYHTDTRYGRYIFRRGSITFQGRRNSFLSGTDVGYACTDGFKLGNLKIKGVWKLISSNTPERGLFVE